MKIFVNKKIPRLRVGIFLIVFTRRQFHKMNNVFVFGRNGFIDSLAGICYAFSVDDVGESSTINFPVRAFVVKLRHAEKHVTAFSFADFFFAV